jgi:excisionase family DNA binding protein
MEKTLTVKQVAEKLQVSPATVYKYTENKTIPCVKIGNRTRILEDELTKYLASCKKAQSKK